mmetsp:Transcript_2482/g.3546  ORF Transcript_2482/g.3546 Transcript_2482/m.3546 type:complete len:94 (-) Transcript_2482:1273-1554(-)
MQSNGAAEELKEDLVYLRAGSFSFQIQMTVFFLCSSAPPPLLQDKKHAHCQRYHVQGSNRLIGELSSIDMCPSFCTSTCSLLSITFIFVRFQK